MNFIIEAKGLNKSFKSGGATVEAVRDVTFQLEPGIIFGFLGPNGAGKTTTLRMLTTLLAPTKGSAVVAGHDLFTSPQEIRKTIGYVSQKGGCYRSMTGRENIVLQGQLYGLSKQEAEKRATELIELLELSAFCDRPVETYSGGQARRVDIAMGVVHAPVVLFLDEPTTGLDPQSRAYLWNLLRGLKSSRNTTIFLTTHYLEEADALCDRVAIIDHGTLVRDGSPAELKRGIAGDIITIGIEESGDRERALQAIEKAPRVKSVHVGDGALVVHVDVGEEVLAQILKLLHTGDVPFTTVSLTRPTLNDVFLHATGHSLREN